MKEKWMTLHRNINWGKWNVQQAKGTRKEFYKQVKHMGEKKGKYMFL